MLLTLMHMQNLVKTHLFFLKILSGNEILTSFKGCNSVTSWWKWMINKPKLDVVSINAYTKFGQNPFHLDVININAYAKNENVMDRWTDNLKQYTPTPRTWYAGLTSPKLDVVNINAYANLVKIHSFIHKILSGNEILMSFKSGNSVTNWHLTIPS